MHMSTDELKKILKTADRVYVFIPYLEDYVKVSKRQILEKARIYKYRIWKVSKTLTSDYTESVFIEG